MTNKQLPRLLFRVDEVIEHPGQHLETLCFDAVLDCRYRVGDLVEIRRPDRTNFQAKSGLVKYSPDPQIVLSGKPVKKPVGLVFDGLDKQDIPLGSEIWLVVDHPVALKDRKFQYIGTKEERASGKAEPEANT